MHTTPPPPPPAPLAAAVPPLERPPPPPPDPPARPNSVCDHDVFASEPPDGAATLPSRSQLRSRSPHMPAFARTTPPLPPLLFPPVPPCAPRFCHVAEVDFAVPPLTAVVPDATPAPPSVPAPYSAPRARVPAVVPDAAPP